MNTYMDKADLIEIVQKNKAAHAEAYDLGRMDNPHAALLRELEAAKRFLYRDCKGTGLCR